MSKHLLKILLHPSRLKFSSERSYLITPAARHDLRHHPKTERFTYGIVIWRDYNSEIKLLGTFRQAGNHSCHKQMATEAEQINTQIHGQLIYGAESTAGVEVADRPETTARDRGYLTSHL